MAVVAHRHRLFVPWHDALVAAGVELPADLDGRLRLQRAGMAQAGLRNKSLLVRTVDALASAGVMPVVLKGYPLAVRYYREPLLRPVTDVDILVRRSELPAVVSALQSLGLQRYDDPVEEMEQYHHHIAFCGRAGYVEVHFRATSGLGLKEREDGLALETVPFDLEGREVRILRPEDELVYLAIHAAQHVFLRLCWLYDIKLFLEGTRVDWARAAAIARAAGMTPAVYASLHATRVAFGREGFPDISGFPQPAAWQRILITRIFTTQRLVAATVPDRKLARWLAHTALAEGPVRMVRAALDAVKLKTKRVIRSSVGRRH